MVNALMQIGLLNSVSHKVGDSSMKIISVTQNTNKRFGRAFVYTKSPLEANLAAKWLAWFVENIKKASLLDWIPCE